MEARVRDVDRRVHGAGPRLVTNRTIQSLRPTMRPAYRTCTPAA